jgi:starch phosphorylase
LNVARIGKFSSDRTILEYNRDIWCAEPITIERNHAEPAKSGGTATKAEAVASRAARNQG